MQLIPVKTRVLVPPQDNLLEAISEAAPVLHERDIVLVTSKVISIHEGRSVPVSSGVKKRDLVIQEAEQWIEGGKRFSISPITLKFGAIFIAAGIDESNANGHYLLLPEKPFESAEYIWKFLTETYGISELGVIVTDSHTAPLRRGATSIGIGFWGFHPVNHHTGKKDIFGREMLLSATNLVDAVSGAATAVGGELDECTPLCIARDVPQVRFTKQDTRHELLVAPEDDIYEPILKPFFEKHP